ncbi:hypothetical protein [Marinoscillum sp. 108]|uniref:hypothetical protein n=1 Tax=Marinoscillum sp. 108 TaxID=2653151 RepID=UPI0012F198A6|nr:hypothetical protein [Marinoscillum sp. 108]VXD12815.1 conserved hypothetical protein [Marinoscillum sp. 108]
MNPTPHQIDSYLRNELSSSELSAFEAEMSNNPELMDQVRFEQTVVEGISQYRKAELKARLDAIEIGSGWMGIGQLGSSALVKSVGGVLVASLVGVSAYFVFTAEENITSPEIIESIEITSPKQSESYQFEFPELSVQKVSSVVSESSPNVAEKSSATSDEKVKALPTVQKSVASVDEETEFVPVVDLPDLGELSEEKGLKIEDANLPEMNEMDVVSSKGESPISVETIQRNSESIKYKYFDGKLFLYGDFKSTPYEIIEINRPSERKLYLFYDQEYYSIIVSDKVQELSPITNHQLLQELEIVRNNKL